MPLPDDYAERVYAGVLGKIIGVYLGRPFEGWTYERIMSELGEIWYYVHEQHGVPLVVTDDDISGTFTFLRALPDYDNNRALTAAQIGQTWLNYIVENRTILWWGGMGNSTEHTAYLRLMNGVPAPRSGSIDLNGKVVAEQIGSQIFIDGWAMVAPGDPALAADLARRAASVSHDGEAIYGAQVLAAMEAAAFVERDLNRLLDLAVTYIPRDSIIYRVIHDIRDWRAGEPDWRRTRERIAARYGYDTYGGNCHIVPNHALIHLGLLYGGDDFQRALMITNTSGWDTDCNSGNVGCLLGIKNGLAGIDAGPDWRGPVADRLYLPTADGGRAITDALTETYHIINVGRALDGEPPLMPKDGARFNFDLPGAVQGWQPDESVPGGASVRVENVASHGASGTRCLALHYRHLAAGRTARVATPTFIPPSARQMLGYALMASPTLYSGQTVRARVVADVANTTGIECGLYVQVYGAGDAPEIVAGPPVMLAPGAEHVFSWTVPDTHGAPIAAIGLQLAGASGATGTLYLDYFSWSGAPGIVLGPPPHDGTMWRHAWANALDQLEVRCPEPYRLIQNAGRGMLIQGTREWTDYRVEATFTPHLAAAFGLAARVQGLRRYYALLVRQSGVVQLVKMLDGEAVLAEAEVPWELYRPYALSLAVLGTTIRAALDGRVLFEIRDAERPLDGGGIGLIVDEGRVASGSVVVAPS